MEEMKSIQGDGKGQEEMMKKHMDVDTLKKMAASCVGTCAR